MFSKKIARKLYNIKMLSFFVPFAAIFTAEFGDKTQLSLLLLAACYQNSSHRKKHGTAIFAGAMLAFFIADGFAILAGSYLAGIHLISETYIKTAAGILFIILGVLILKDFFYENESPLTPSENPDQNQNPVHLKNVFLAAFTSILLTELGDKTQIASAMFGAKFSNGIMVLAGTLAALGILSATAIWAGGTLAKKISPRILHAAGGAIFIITGAVTIIFNF